MIPIRAVFWPGWERHVSRHLLIASIACSLLAHPANGSGQTPHAPPPAAHAIPTAPPTARATRAFDIDPVDAESALDRLRAGNARFVLGESNFPHSGADRRYETSQNGQQPFATILTCADSRVPPELLFDSGIGDLFVIRVAGNVADVDEIASIEYGVDHLHTPVVVIMGHTKCGAVTAVCEHGPLEGALGQLTDNIIPAVERAHAENPMLEGDRLVQQAIRENVRQAQADLILGSQAVRDRLAAGSIKVVGAIYDLHSGSVLWLGSHPMQDQLLNPPQNARPGIGGWNSHSNYNRGWQPDAPRPASWLANPGGKADLDHAKPAAADTHTRPAKADEKQADSHDEHHATDATEEHANPHAIDERSAAEKNGLWVPAAFMAGGIALSTGILFAIRSRRPAA